METILAIFIGIIIGILAATGFWYLKNKSLPIQTSPASKVQSSQSPTEIKSELKLEISNTEITVVNTSIYELKLKTNPLAKLIISHNANDYFEQSDKNGDFTKKLELTIGINSITVSVYDNNNYLQQKLILDYEEK